MGRKPSYLNCTASIAFHSCIYGQCVKLLPTSKSRQLFQTFSQAREQQCPWWPGAASTLEMEADASSPKSRTSACQSLETRFVHPTKVTSSTVKIKGRNFYFFCVFHHRHYAGAERQAKTRCSHIVWGYIYFWC